MNMESVVITFQESVVNKSPDLVHTAHRKRESRVIRVVLWVLLDGSNDSGL